MQDRVALFAKTTFFIALGFLVATSAADYGGAAARYFSLGRACHAGGTLIALAVWMIARGRQNLTPERLQLMDVVGTLGITACFAGLGHFAVQPYGSYTALLAITHVTIARAMIVPSIPRRTLFLTAASFVAFVLSRATVPLSADMVAVPGSRARGVIEAVLWGSAGAAVATVASVVIYGLQERAREALQLGQYALQEKIGDGGMGEVYRAHHAMLRRPTAIKLLSGEGSEEQLRRFEKEVQLTARLTHPNTISIYDYGRTPDGIFYYAMELLEGMTLEQLVQRHGPQPAPRVIHLLSQICGALAEAHGIGLVHRDIKPANLHLCRRGDISDFVKVLDFGLVREVKNDVAVGESNVNAIVGTPLYLSPEAIVSPGRIDARADIYGLGCVAYFLLTGHPPFDGETVVELCAHHLHTAPPPFSEDLGVPDDLARVILECLAKKPEQRPATARDLAARLAQCRDAAAWTAEAADAWWAGEGAAAVEGLATKPVTGLSRTILCADLEERMSHQSGTVARDGARATRTSTS